MNIVVEKVGPTRPEDLVIGAYYEIKGTNSHGFQLPHQVIRIDGRPRPAGLLNAMALARVTVWMSLGGINGVACYVVDDYPLGAVNVREHGGTDIHLERIDPKDMKASDPVYDEIAKALKPQELVLP